MYVNVEYYLFAVPGILLSSWAQARISRAYAVGSRMPAASGFTGAEAAAQVMKAGGVSGVRIEPAVGEFSDHYDPHQKVLRLSGNVYGSRSLAALGVAAHESGHAIQDASGYPGLVVRNLVVPLASIGSTFFWLPILAGLLLDISRLIMVGIVLFSLTVVFQLINLPVEFDASRRGRELLQSSGLVSPEEDPVVKKVLNAAAWTYVAGTLTSLLTLLYDFVQFRIGGRRRSDD
jgi:Zn-dependent membrane protease YugP